MNEKLTTYVNELFAPYDGIRSVNDLKQDLLNDLQERLADLQAEGQDEDTALQITMDSIGDIDQTVQEVANLSRSLERQVRINLSARNLHDSDFAGVRLHQGKFKASVLRDVDYSGADLTGTSFLASDARGANFDGANLTDCTFYATDLKATSFRQSLFVRTRVNVSTLKGATFAQVNLADVKLTKSDLGGVIFEDCVFNGVDFESSDLRGVSFDGQTFIGVNFDKSALKNASFRGATLKNVAFRLPLSVTNRSYRDFHTVSFDGATMDKLTYAGLKGLMVVDLSNVRVI